MEQFKRVQVVMLPTENTKQGIYLNPVPSINIIHFWDFRISNSYIAQHLYIISDDEIKEGDWVLFSYNRENGMLFKFIEKNKFGSSKLYNPITKKEEWFGDMFVYKKIIATTDKLYSQDYTPLGCSIGISLPKPSQQFIEKFIEEYNKGNVIKYVLVEYVNTFKSVKNYYINKKDLLYDKLKINPKDNTVTIKKLKDSWNREEVIEIIKKFNKESCGQPWFDTDENWIKENL